MRKVDGFVVSSGAGSCIYLVRTYVGLTTKLGANFELRTSGLLSCDSTRVGRKGGPSFSLDLYRGVMIPATPYYYRPGRKETAGSCHRDVPQPPLHWTQNY